MHGIRLSLCLKFNHHTEVREDKAITPFFCGWAEWSPMCNQSEQLWLNLNDNLRKSEGHVFVYVAAATVVLSHSNSQAKWTYGGPY